MHRLLKETAHRPWPLPARGWLWRQTWLDLAFIHYRVDSARLRSLLPEGLRLQEFDGSAWVALVPFRMSGVMRRPLPDLPFFSRFPELNLRTYVEADGKPGVWFLSLDADSWPAVLGGRLLYGVPCFHARITLGLSGGWYEYACVRSNGAAAFRGRYRPVSAPCHPSPGSFEHWAAERYCLYSDLGRRGVVRIEVHHAPLSLHQAEVEILESTVMDAAGIAPSEPEPRCHFSPGAEVLAYAKEELANPFADEEMAPFAPAS